MNRRTMILVGVGVALLVAIVATGVALRGRTGSNTNTTNVPLANTNVNSSGTAVVEDAAKRRDAEEIRRVTIIVVEGATSGPQSESNRRLNSVASYLTPNLQVFARAQAARSQAPVNPEKLDASRVVTDSLTQQESTRAIIEVTVQTSTSTVPTPPNAGDPTVTYTKYRLSLQKSGTAWLVSELTSLGNVTL